MEQTNLILNNIGPVSSATDHYSPSVRLLQINKNENDGSCGFHLSRSRWDPYPWVSAVDETTPAELTGLKVGDCVLEVNGEDILGLRISDIANLVKAKSDCVTLLLWSTGNDPSCDPDSLCCGPMPLSLERLSASMQTILAALECPVCMDIIPPPVLQCQNGHILCVKCRARSERCPICRQRYSIVRALIAEQIYSSIIAAFKLNDDNNRTTNKKLREKLFGAKYKNKKQQQILCDGNCNNKISNNNSNSNGGSNSHPKSSLLPTAAAGGGNGNGGCNILQTQTNKFLARILGKACSMDSLTTVVKTSNKDTECLDIDNMTKSKHFSLSTNDLSKPENLVSIPRCPSVNRILLDVVAKETSHNDGNLPLSSTNSTTNNNSLTLNGLALKKRPSSLNASVEYVDIEIPNLRMSSATLIKNEIMNETANYFKCPYNCCMKKLKEMSLENHVRVDHNIPIVSFGTSSAEISLPPKAPIENAVLILTLDNKQFWLKLTIDKTDDSIFTMALLQGTLDESSMYMLEARLRNRVENKLLEKELITRSIVYSMMETSWDNINSSNSSNSSSSNRSSSSTDSCCNNEIHCSCYRNTTTTATTATTVTATDNNFAINHINNNNINDIDLKKSYVVDTQKRGIFYNQTNIQSTFNADSELLLKIAIKHIQYQTKS